MHSTKQWFLISILVALLAGIAAAQPVAAAIDAAHTGQPITKLIFGGFMEPATTQVWAEMLSDRKFFNEINSKPAASPAGGFGRRGPQRRWTPVGADEFVAMDSKNAYVGERSPRIRLEAATPHGILCAKIEFRKQSKRAGKVLMNFTTVCPIVLANDLMQINLRAEGAHLLPRCPRTAPCRWPTRGRREWPAPALLTGE